MDRPVSFHLHFRCHWRSQHFLGVQSGGATFFASSLLVVLPRFARLNYSRCPRQTICWNSCQIEKIRWWQDHLANFAKNAHLTRGWFHLERDSIKESTSAKLLNYLVMYPFSIQWPPTNTPICLNLWLPPPSSHRWYYRFTCPILGPKRRSHS